MKFKPLWRDYHSEATSLWLELYPNKETETLRIHISSQFLDQDENDEATNEACDMDAEEAPNEQDQESPVSPPLMDSTNQASEAPTNERASNLSSKHKKSALTKAEAESSTIPRQRRRKRRRDSPDKLLPASEQEAAGTDDVRCKEHTVSAQMPSDHEQGLLLLPTVEGNPCQDDPRKGQRRWLLSIVTARLEPLSQTQYPSLAAKEESMLERQMQPSEHESMDCDLDSSSTSESRKNPVSSASSIPQHCPQEMMECDNSLQTDLVTTLREEDAHIQTSDDIPNQETGPQDMTVEHSEYFGCSPCVIQRVRRRHRRLVNTIGGSALGSKGIIVLRPHLFSIYDSPLLVSIWTIIRRIANRKRIANHVWWSEDSSQSAMIQEIATKASFWRRPIAHPHLISFWWRRRMEIAFFRQFSRAISNVAIAKLDHVVSTSTLRHLSDRHLGQRPISMMPKKPKPKKKVSKSPFRYCLLDILQGNAGTFWNVSLGWPSQRRETQKRELKAIVPYTRKPHSPNPETQQRLQFAILLAWNVAKTQEERHEEEDRVETHCDTENQSLLPEERKPLDETGILPKKKHAVRILPPASEQKSVATQNNLNSTSYDDNDLEPTVPIPDQGLGLPSFTKKQPARIQRQKEIGQARQTELSLLERFGLAPSAGPHDNASKPGQGRNKRPQQPLLSPEEVHQSKRGKWPAKQHVVSKLSDQEKERAPSTVHSDDPVSLNATKEAKNPHHFNFPEKSHEQVSSPKRSSAPNPQPQQPPSCQPMSEVASCRNLDERSEHYRNWQPKNFDLDDGSIWSFNDVNNSGIQVVTTPKALATESRKLESPAESLTQNTAPPMSQPQTTSRVVSDKKERKRTRKVAKQKKKKEHKEKARKRKEKKSHQQLFDQPLPEKVLLSLDEDAVEEVRPRTNENSQAPTRQLSVLKEFVVDNGSRNQPIVIDDVEDDTPSSLPRQAAQLPSLVLCSENFLETWGDTAARLVSGDWHRQTTSRHTNGGDSGRRFCFVDTNLVDACGVDIELPDRQGLVVSALSSWHSDGGFENLMMRVVGLISSTRFRYLSIFLCADVDLDDATIDRIATIQSAVLHQGEGLVTATSFTLVSPNALAASIGQSMCKLDAAWGLEEVESFLHDDRSFERLLFLIRLIPTLTTTSVLWCLMSSPAANGSTEDISRLWFQSVFQDERERKRMQSFDPKVLHPSVIAQLSFALGSRIGNETVFQS